MTETQPFLFVSDHPLIQHKLAKLRDVKTKPKLFRDLIKEMAMLLVYEATKNLRTAPVTVTTPICESEQFRVADSG
jgi:uracil phosphoribosyltransferase